MHLKKTETPSCCPYTQRIDLRIVVVSLPRFVLNSFVLRAVTLYLRSEGRHTIHMVLYWHLMELGSP